MIRTIFVLVSVTNITVRLIVALNTNIFLGISLTGEHAGHTKKKVYSALDMSLGGVLFIDEAYSLVTSTYGEEVINTLVSKKKNGNV
jgi:hypothetical protein